MAAVPNTRAWVESGVPPAPRAPRRGIILASGFVLLSFVGAYAVGLTGTRARVVQSAPPPSVSVVAGGPAAQLRLAGAPPIEVAVRPVPSPHRSAPVRARIVTSLQAPTALAPVEAAPVAATSPPAAAQSTPVAPAPAPVAPANPPSLSPTRGAPAPSGASSGGESHTPSKGGGASPTFETSG